MYNIQQQLKRLPFHFRELRSGSLQQNHLVDGSRVILIAGMHCGEEFEESLLRKSKNIVSLRGLSKAIHRGYLRRLDNDKLVPTDKFYQENATLLNAEIENCGGFQELPSPPLPPNAPSTTASAGAEDDSDVYLSLNELSKPPADKLHLRPLQPPLAPVTVSVTIRLPTGGHFNIDLEKSSDVDELKQRVANHIKLAKDRFCLLYRNQ